MPRGSITTVASPCSASLAVMWRIENADGASTADAIGLMAEARRRALEQYGVELEHEVEFLGPLELPPLER